MPIMMLLVVIVPVFFLTMIIFFMLRYRRCPSDQILVVYGKVAGANKSLSVFMGVGPWYGRSSRITNTYT